MTVISENTSERLDVVKFRVIVTKRPKLACRACPGTAQWRQFADLFHRFVDTPRERLATETHR
jgi:transposase